jgi:hypothetical protein
MKIRLTVGQQDEQALGGFATARKNISPAIYLLAEIIRILLSMEVTSNAP